MRLICPASKLDSARIQQKMKPPATLADLVVSPSFQDSFYVPNEVHIILVSCSSSTTSEPKSPSIQLTGGVTLAGDLPVLGTGHGAPGVPGAPRIASLLGEVPPALVLPDIWKEEIILRDDSPGPKSLQGGAELNISRRWDLTYTVVRHCHIAPTAGRRVSVRQTLRGCPPESGLSPRGLVTVKLGAVRAMMYDSFLLGCRWGSCCSGSSWIE
ncbi:hypothetical protein PGTUg99_023967 [Puccinia graminis f. sp. tritici]|uniref:Uncharacterized protein n=1 Tax=Puccinia graminis f. sp. tritici TaxID=56615 RepID=A0A5B0SE05_PUCGR|nr:hypothetical protein PGTUg99_023967 [Puccinia graminis f. sp. tritici]